MSSRSEHKMYNYEVTPPQGVWARISSALDESELNASFPSRLRNFKATPPPEAWSKIAALLYGSSFIHDYSARLETIEINPPVAVWNKIQSALDNEVPETAENRKIIPWYRYAAAAVILGLIVWAGAGILNNNKNAVPVADKSNLPVKMLPPDNPGKADPVETNNLPQPLALGNEEARNDAALEASKKTFAKLDVPRSGKIKNAAHFYFAAETEEPTTRSLPDFENVEMDKINVNNRYIVFMTPDGNIVRMSKKLSDLVCCVSGETEEKECIDQMKKWREKLAYTTAGHSPGNFLEILNLVCSLEED